MIDAEGRRPSFAPSGAPYCDAQASDHCYLTMSWDSEA